MGSVSIVRIPSASFVLRKQRTGILIQGFASTGQPFPVRSGYIVDPVLHLGQPHVLGYLRARAAAAHVAPLPSAVVDDQPLDVPLQLRRNETANRLIDGLLTGMHLAQTGIGCRVPVGAAQVLVYLGFFIQSRLQITLSLYQQLALLRRELHIHVAVSVIDDTGQLCAVFVAQAVDEACHQALMTVELVPLLFHLGSSGLLVVQITEHTEDIVHCDHDCMQASRLLPRLPEPGIRALGVPGLAAPVAWTMRNIFLYFGRDALEVLKPERGVDMGLHTLRKRIFLHMPGDRLLTLFVCFTISSKLVGHDAVADRWDQLRYQLFGSIQ